MCAATLPAAQPWATNMQNLHAIPPVLVTVSEACRLTGLGRTSIYVLIGSGRLESFQIGKRRLVKYASILALAGEAA